MCDDNFGAYTLSNSNWIMLKIDVEDITTADLQLKCSCTLTSYNQQFQLRQTVEVTRPELVDCYWSWGQRRCINDLYIPCNYNWDCRRWRVDEYQQYFIYLNNNNQQSWSLDIDELPEDEPIRDVEATILLEKWDTSK